MDMTPKDVAQLLLNRRNAKFSAVVDGQTKQSLGPDGFKYAVQRRWIEIGESYDDICVTRNLTRYNDMLAALNETSSITPAQKPLACDARQLESDHASDYSKSLCRQRVVEAQQPVVTGPDKHWSTFDITMLEDDDLQPGDAVVIGEQGEQFQATVQSKTDDGRYVLSFGTKRPANVKPVYDKNELAKTTAPKAGQPPAAAPVKASASSTGAPAAPGIGH